MPRSTLQSWRAMSGSTPDTNTLHLVRKPRSKTLDPAPYALDLEVTTCKEVVSLNGEVVSLKAALHAVGEVRDAQVLTP